VSVQSGCRGRNAWLPLLLRLSESGIQNFPEPPATICAHTISHQLARWQLRNLSIPSEELISLLRDIFQSTAPLQCLLLPRILPTLDFLQTITALFPELRRLSVVVLNEPEDYERMSFFSGGHKIRRPGPRVLDTRSPNYRDQDAFVDIREDEVSEAEEGGTLALGDLLRVSPSRHRISGSSNIHVGGDRPYSDALLIPCHLQNIVNWRRDFTHRLEVLLLKLEKPSSRHFKIPAPPTIAQEHQMIARLSRLCPLLYKAQIGFRNNSWRHTSEVWSRVGSNVAATPKVESRLGKSTPGAVRLDSTRLRLGESLQVDSSRLESMKSDFSEHFLRPMVKQGVHDI
jgi:hypothetical protein